MKKISVILFLLAFILVNGCSAKNDIEPTAAPPAVGSTPERKAAETQSISEEPLSDKPAEAQQGDEPDDDVYTKVIQLEGMDETVNYELVRGRYGYTMPIDVDRFEYKAGEDADYFQCLANENVYIRVSYIESSTVAEAAGSQTEDTSIVRFDESEVAIGEHEATRIHVVYGNEPDSKIIDHYLIAGGGGVYLISCVYFMEAAEGFGARMYYITEDFKIG